MRYPVLILLFAAYGAALSQQYPFRNYAAKDGLTRDAVRTICQDSQGFLWLGTTDGINRYDGAAFTLFNASNGLPSEHINHIVEDDSGALWIATNYAGIARWSGGRFTGFLPVPDTPAALTNRVNHILIDSSTGIWLGTDGGLLRFNGTTFTKVFDKSFVQYIVNDSNGNIWCATGIGLMCIDRNTHTADSISALKGEEVTRIAVDGDGSLWVGTGDGLKHFLAGSDGRPVPGAIPNTLKPLEHAWVRALLVDQHGNLWIGTAGMGLYRFAANGRITRFTEENGLAGNVVVDIKTDREGNLWLATTTGLSKLISERFVNYSVAQGIPDHPVAAIAEDRSGSVWFGTRLGLTQLRNGTIRTFTAKDGLANDYVLAMHAGKNGMIWCGTTTGVSAVTASGRSVTIRDYGRERGWDRTPGVTNRARSIFEDDRGNMWFGTDLGVSLLARDGFITYRIPPFDGSILVTGIVQDASGSIWAATYSAGVVRFAVGTDSRGRPTLKESGRFGLRDGLAGDDMRCAYKDRDGRLWFGSRFGGVSRLTLKSDGTFGVRNFTKENGLLSGAVNCVTQDSRGDIWLATDRGAEQISFGPGDTARIRHFSIHDGLAGDGLLYVYEDHDGLMWFGTFNGVTRYDPSIAPPPSLPPPVHIMMFRVFGKSDSVSLSRGSAHLDYSQHSVSFDFIGVSFRNEQQVRYRYMLEGLDSAWSDITDRRYVNYTHLPPGDYRFVVSARTADGVWSRDHAAFGFVIAPPFWARWWFVAGAILLAGGIVWTVYHYRVQHLLELERVRTRIAADLHDDIGSTLSSISIFSEMAKRDASASAPHAAEMLTRIGESSRAILESLDDIVWSINPGNDSLDDVALRMREYATGLLEAKGVALNIDIPSGAGQVRLSMDVRRQFYLIFKEAVNNVVRHSNCRNASISMVQHGDALVLRITDDGTGIDRDRKRTGNGMRNMQRRAALAGGSVQFESQAGTGTTVTVQVRIT